MSAVFALLVIAVLMLATPPARADFQADFDRCRADIVRIGDDPRTPYEAYCLGISYQLAINRKRDSARAVAALRRAAEQNFAPAQALLGYMLEKGIGISADPAGAFQLYQRSAQQNDEGGLFNLGRAFAHGIGTAVDLNRARGHYERAAAMGSREARDALANLGRAPAAQTPQQQEFSRGATLYKSGKHADAAQIFLALAERGYAPAQQQIGSQYANGEGVSRDDRRAAQWFLKSAEQNYAIAQNSLAELYELGRGVPDNWVESARWAQRSADQGNAYGMLLVGRAYQFGIGVPQDRQQAIRWFDKAGSRGDNQGDYWARNLRARGSFIGFRNEKEEAFVVGGRLPTDMQLVFAEPRGRTFHNTAERDKHVRDLKATTLQNEDDVRHGMAQDRYARCKRGETGESYCRAP